MLRYGNIQRALLILVIAGLLGQCGRKKSAKVEESELIDLIPFVPTAWDGEKDWEGNSLQIEVIP